jgi:hypothetical protein
MPIPLEKIQVVEDEIQRLSHDEDYDIKDLHTTITPPEQDFSYLHKISNIKRTVHYDIEPIHDHEDQPLQSNSKISHIPTINNNLRRRYIAHWGLPGNLRIS